MLFTLGALAIFLQGGLTGPFLALVPTDLFLHETYWVVSHFHQTMFGGFVFPFLAATYYRFPKVTGYRYSEKLGKAHFWTMFVGFTALTLALYRVGLLGMLRRVADYVSSDFIPWNLAATISGFVIGLSMVLFLVNMLRSLIVKRPAETNPWRSRSPEWQIPSPPPEENFDHQPVVVGGPYDYGVPQSIYVRFEDAEA
jgi:cytochrome c oxidase subunit 1